MECLDAHDGGCAGPVEFRHPLSGTGKSFPRCEAHWDLRLATQERIVKRYNPWGSTPPEGFDPTYAGEEW